MRFDAFGCRVARSARRNLRGLPLGVSGMSAASVNSTCLGTVNRASLPATSAVSSSPVTRASGRSTTKAAAVSPIFGSGTGTTRHGSDAPGGGQRNQRCVDSARR